jgi:hypothetical protein
LPNAPENNSGTNGDEHKAQQYQRLAQANSEQFGEREADRAENQRSKNQRDQNDDGQATCLFTAGPRNLLQFGTHTLKILANPTNGAGGDVPAVVFFLFLPPPAWRWFPLTGGDPTFLRFGFGDSSRATATAATLFLFPNRFIGWHELLLCLFLL